jgi:hypothetical protein
MNECKCNVDEDKVNDGICYGECNEKCDRGDCKTCYPIYYYDEATDQVLVRKGK